MNIKDIPTKDLKAELTRRANAEVTTTVNLVQFSDGTLHFETGYLYSNKPVILDSIHLAVKDGKICVIPAAEIHAKQIEQLKKLNWSGDDK